MDTEDVLRMILKMYYVYTTDHKKAIKKNKPFPATWKLLSTVSTPAGGRVSTSASSSELLLVAV